MLLARSVRSSYPINFWGHVYLPYDAQEFPLYVLHSAHGLHVRFFELMHIVAWVCKASVCRGHTSLLCMMMLRVTTALGDSIFLSVNFKYKTSVDHFIVRTGGHGPCARLNRYA
jgi:hypothetical protein